jgi:hypothetical protein
MGDWKAKEAARAAAAAALAAANPHLITVKKEGDSLRAAAKNMRIELARAFHGVKFSVKSRRFSMGDAIDVKWTDGPNGRQVDAIINKYQCGTFDAMTDCAGSVSSAWMDAFGDARFVHGTRENSDKAIASAVRTVVAKYGDAKGLASVEAFRSGSLWSAGPDGLPAHGVWSLQDLIYQVASARTWAISKAPKAVAMVEETEAA